MVAKFRDFLNTSPQFEELREHLRAGRFHDTTPARRPPAPAPRPGGLEVEGFDDEMADEENDFEDGSEMVIDAQMQNPAMPGGPIPPPFQQAIPVPPALPNLGQPPSNIFPLSLLAASQGWIHPGSQYTAGAWSNLLSNHFVGGVQPPTTNGHMPASVASLAHGSSSRQVSGQHGGASTATIHRVREDEDGPADLS